ncbi:SRPBCC family protein [Halomicroarcula sp. GCM10025324]|uniref:SRPBCC family protein n=1 Tax=Haloarcula TaxID=2237 RepID=UPI0023E7B9CB|nr:SRPBCC family protein [Halomicroarcula sp. ZS-22-S1]
MTTLDETDVSVERTPDGRRIVVSRAVDASRDTVWDVLTDTELWPDWGPSITSVEAATRYIESGTTGRVRTVGGLWLPFEVTACEPYRWTWDVARIPATGHRVDEWPGGSRVVFEIPLLAGGYAPVCARACRKIASLAAESTTTEP